MKIKFYTQIERENMLLTLHNRSKSTYYSNNECNVIMKI